jgi:hypothetical protein
VPKIDTSVVVFAFILSNLTGLSIKGAIDAIYVNCVTSSEAVRIEHPGKQQEA